MTKAKLKENTEKNAMFKDLKKVWRDFNLYNGSNIVLVDDSPNKSFLNSVSVLAQSSLCGIFLLSGLDDVLIIVLC